MVSGAIAASTQSNFAMSVDLARFRGDSTNLYLELYYSFDVSQLSYIKKDGSYQSEMVMNVYFKRSSNDSIAGHQAWRIPFGADDTTSQTKTSRFYNDVMGFFLAPDIYRLVIVATDYNNPEKKDSLSLLIELRPMERIASTISDIELCTSISPSEQNTNNRFYKNTYEVRPNPARLFGATQPVLFYYLEMYNLLSIASSSYRTRVTVTNSYGKEVITQERIRKRSIESSVEVGTMKVHTLRTGSYTFSFAIHDSSASKIVSSSKRFFIYNPNLPADTIGADLAAAVPASEYATMTEDDLDREFAISRYIATREEISRYNGVQGVEAKRRLLFEFWTNRDQDKSTPEVEVKREYLQRVDYANANFKTGFREGWKTDRGRVFIVYGPPDEIERHANEIDVKPYEIWSYHSIQGGVTFVFGDRTGFSDYLLLHSTHRDELHDENWMQQLQAQ
jgi:GWxTD domain-containing protein